jgi:hypothetical protein
MAPWKTTAIFFHLILRLKLLSEKSRTFFPLTYIFPLNILPGGFIERMIAAPKVLLPEADSPTIPIDSLPLISKEMSSTALTLPLLVK